MSATPDPLPLVLQFLEAVANHVDEIPDPFSDDPTRPDPVTGTVPSIALRGQIARLVEDERKLHDAFVRRRGEAVQAAIDRGGNRTGDEVNQLRMYGQLEADRANCRGSTMATLFKPTKPCPRAPRSSLGMAGVSSNSARAGRQSLTP